MCPFLVLRAEWKGCCIPALSNLAAPRIVCGPAELPSWELVRNVEPRAGISQNLCTSMGLCPWVHTEQQPCRARVLGPLLWLTVHQPCDFGRVHSISRLCLCRLRNIKMELLCSSRMIMITCETRLRSYKQSLVTLALNSSKYAETRTGFFLHILFEWEVGTYINILFWNTVWLHRRSILRSKLCILSY